MPSITVTYQGKKEAVQLEGSTVGELLRQLKINPETVLVGRNGEIVVESERLKGGDRIEIIRTISGG